MMAKLMMREMVTRMMVTRVTVMNEYDENEGCDDGDNDDASGSGDDNNLIELCKSRLVMLRGKRAPKISITCQRIIVIKDKYYVIFFFLGITPK